MCGAEQVRGVGICWKMCPGMLFWQQEYLPGNEMFWQQEYLSVNELFWQQEYLSVNEMF